MAQAADSIMNSFITVFRIGRGGLYVCSQSEMWSEFLLKIQTKTKPKQKNLQTIYKPSELKK